MNQREIEVAKANIEAVGGVPIVSVCMDCGKEYDVKPGGEGYPPEQRKSHGYCQPCGNRAMERFELCLDTPDIR